MARGHVALLLFFSLQLVSLAAREEAGASLASPSTDAAQCDEDEAVLLQAKARPSNSGAFPDLGGPLGDLADKAKAAVSDAQGTAAAAVKTGLLQLADTLNGTLLEVDEKVDSLSKGLVQKKEEFIRSVTTVVQGKLDKSLGLNSSTEAAEALLNKTFDDVSGLWTAMALSGRAAGTAFAGGLKLAGLDDVASEANQTLDRALQEADSFKGSIEQVRDEILQVSSSEASRQLASINRTLETSLQQAGVFAESFAGAFDELSSGVTDSISKKSLTGKGVASSVKTALAGKLDPESMREVKAAYSSVLQTAQLVVGNVMSIASDLGSGVEIGMEATGIKPEKSAAPPDARLRWAVWVLVPVSMGVTLCVACMA